MTKAIQTGLGRMWDWMRACVSRGAPSERSVKLEALETRTLFGFFSYDPIDETPPPLDQPPPPPACHCNGQHGGPSNSRGPGGLPNVSPPHRGNRDNGQGNPAPVILGPPYGPNNLPPNWPGSGPAQAASGWG